MISFEEIERFLPKYLSPTAEQKLFAELEQFPDNIDKRFYSYLLKKKDIIFQGDGIKDLLVINLPDTRTGNAPSMIISNTCDVDPSNLRFFASRILYAPIFNLAKYEKNIIEDGLKDAESVKSHIETIRKQFVSQIFYLPPGGDLQEESIVFLDRIINLPVGYIPKEEIANKKIFTLSDYGFYLFLFKLSIHFTRIREDFERGSEDVKFNKKSLWKRIWG